MERRPTKQSSLPLYSDVPAAGSTGSGTTTPTRGGPPSSKRKQTILALIDELAELRDEQNRSAREFDDKRDRTNVDERFQSEGADAFFCFQNRIKDLDKELQNFSNAVRQLGSSAGLLSSAFHLRQRLSIVLSIFLSNAADLFPRRVKKDPPEPIKPFTRKMHRPPPHLARPTLVEVDPEDLPQELENLARDFKVFLNCLNEFPEFTDTAVNSSVLMFEADLKYFASCLKEYDGQLRFPAVQRYIHDVSAEIGDHVENITSNVTVFVETGVPTIRFAQKHAASNLLNLSTIATFFSAVTATTIQYSFDRTEHAIDVSVNLFWFGSLVFSIASAVNSLLGLTWKKTLYRSPRHKVPLVVMIWIKRSPLIFLVISVAMFSAGLVCFCYATQPISVAISTLILTCFSSFGLAAVSIWFASERWAFAKHKGRRWLGDVIDDASRRTREAVASSLEKAIPAEKVKTVADWSSRAGQRMSSVVIAAMKAKRTTEEGLPTTRSTDEESAGPSSPPHSRRPSAAAAPTPLNSPAANTATVTFPDTLPQPSAAKENGTPEDTAAAAAAAPAALTPRKRFANAAWKVARAVKSAAPPSPVRQMTGNTVASGSDLRSRRDTFGASNEGLDFKPSKIAALVPALKSLSTTQYLDEHQALVRHLQFSPSGKWLATCSWDRTTRVWKVPNSENEPFSLHRVLLHANGFVGQVAWSPDGSLLLTKTTRTVKVWTESGVCKKTIDRHKNIRAITWLPSGKGFFSVEGSVVSHLDLNGNIQATYSLDRLELQDVAITPNEKRILGVATLLRSQDGLQPVKSRAEKRIVVYNLAERSIENQVPILHDVRDITISRNGQFALVSYENKASPQLWRIDMVKKEGEEDRDARLSLLKTYMPKAEVDFSGSSYFGGTRDELVLCPAKGGEILIWDRESAILLHSLRAQDQGGDLTGIAWNNASPNFMFASAAHDGTVRIWTSPTTPPIPQSDSESYVGREHRDRGSSVDVSSLYVDTRSGATPSRVNSPPPEALSEDRRDPSETDRVDSPLPEESIEEGVQSSRDRFPRDYSSFFFTPPT